VNRLARTAALLSAAALPAAAPIAAPPDTTGLVVYSARCTNCHGPEGRGKATFAIPTLVGSSLSAAEMEKVIASGRAKMPAFAGKLKAEEIKAVALYVKDVLARQKR